MSRFNLDTQIFQPQHTKENVSDKICRGQRGPFNGGLDFDLEVKKSKSFQGQHSFFR